ncbi:MAG: hypothetical protein GX343_02955, partial [Erysipelotrichaceae bacterium]|nr:hypothetical protein [Erysipelotrichaceae bacterium]
SSREVAIKIPIKPKFSQTPNNHAPKEQTRKEEISDKTIFRLALFYQPGSYKEEEVLAVFYLTPHH